MIIVCSLTGCSTLWFFYQPLLLWLEIDAYPAQKGLRINCRNITESKRLKVVDESQTQIETMLTNIPGMVYRCVAGGDNSQHFTFVSSGCRELFEVEPEMVLEDANSIWKLIHPDDYPSFQVSINLAVEKFLPWNWSGRIITPSGQLKWIQGRSTAVNTAGEKVWDGFVFDITERKASEAEFEIAQAALRQSESRFRLIVESAKNYAIFTLDLNGMITSWNSGAKRVLGYSEAEIKGCHARIIFTPEDKEQCVAEQEILTALTEGQAEDERWHIRKDGSRFWASGLMMQLRDEAGNLQGLVKILRDMTQSRQIAEREQFLAKASAVLAGTIDYKTTLFNIARLAVPVLADYCFFDLINLNNQIERVAWHHGSPTKQDWFEQVQRYVPSQDLESHPITKVLLSGTPNLVQLVTDQWMQAAAISPEHFQFMQESQLRSLITVPLIAHECKLGALTVCLTADSGGYYTQTDLSLAKELAHRAALALDNARLYQQAQNANRIKDEFLAVLSHELRSPLNPILGWSKLLRNGKLNAAKTAIALETIERNAKLQAQLIEDLLDISRILSGKLNLSMAPVNLASTIEAAIETVHLAAEAKSIEIQRVFDPNIGQIFGDSARLQQVVWNLLTNAVKFSFPGGRVEIRLECQDSQAQITVSDTGAGINRDFLPFVFESFRQADATITRNFGGLGLGLAIARHLVELHGGTVQVDSSGEGQGATFSVNLPLMKAQAESHLAQGTSSSNTFNSLPLTGIRVLVVDDDADIRDFFSFVLEQAGAKVSVVTSAIEALQALEQSLPDILLSDIGMPQMDGYMLIRQIRAMPPEQGGQIFALALSAYAGEVNRQQAQNAGFQQHVAKPIDPDALIAVILDIISKAN